MSVTNDPEYWVDYWREQAGGFQVELRRAEAELAWLRASILRYADELPKNWDRGPKEAVAELRRRMEGSHHA